MVAAQFNAQLPSTEGRRLTDKILKRALQEGRAGEVPKRRGPAQLLPSTLVNSLVNFAQLRQVHGDEQGPRKLFQVAKSSVPGTKFEPLLKKSSQCRRLMRRVRLASPNLAVSGQMPVDERRWSWLTSSNMTTWFEGYTEQLYLSGFIDDMDAGGQV